MGECYLLPEVLWSSWTDPHHQWNLLYTLSWLSSVPHAAHGKHTQGWTHQFPSAEKKQKSHCFGAQITRWIFASVRRIFVVFIVFISPPPPQAWFHGILHTSQQLLLPCLHPLRSPWMRSHSFSVGGGSVPGKQVPLGWGGVVWIVYLAFFHHLPEESLSSTVGCHQLLPTFDSKMAHPGKQLQNLETRKRTSVVVLCCVVVTYPWKQLQIWKQQERNICGFVVAHPPSNDSGFPLMSPARPGDRAGMREVNRNRTWNPMGPICAGTGDIEIYVKAHSRYLA